MNEYGLGNGRFNGYPLNAMILSGKALEFYIKNTLKPKALPYCGPLFFTSSLTDAGGVTNNGSFGLIDTGIRKLLVTNHHVVADFKKAKEERSATWMCVALNGSELIVLPYDLLLDCDPEVDLATFDMTPLLGECKTKVFYDIPSMPIATVNDRDKLFFLGFPGEKRRIVDGGVVSGTVPYAIEVDGCGVKQFVSNIGRLRYLDENDNPVPFHNAKHGGTSGAPCFLIGGGRELRLAGFIKEAHSYLISVARASLINKDGGIDRSCNEVRA